jgi:UDP-N-acetylmuramate: L-alanyl-gamma-D-glutamyl-meso-diaminopimelate ligase
MVKLSEQAKIMVIEGDEYLTSPIDRRPKFHLYKPDIGIISGIAWDHVNVFPTFENYVEQFKIFAGMISLDGAYIYYQGDEILNKISSEINHPHKYPYSVHRYHIKSGKSYLETPYGDIQLQIFGKHNLANLNAAKLACNAVGISDEQFYHAIASFKGASKRLELVAENENCCVYKDFAHSPSKLKATIEAVKEQFPDRKLVACMELHTFSSLSEEFLKEYKNAMNLADIGIVYYNPEAVEHKKLSPITSEMIYKSFNREDLEIFSNSKLLIDRLLTIENSNTQFLLMSSGNFNGIDIEQLANNIVYLQP